MDYEQMVVTARDELFACAERRFSEEEVVLIRDAYALAEEAHRPQKRKSGEPYILHPIAVAMIVNCEIGLGPNPIAAALLHDVVEDTDYTIQDIKERFGEDVAMLVNVVTKRKEENTDSSLQVNNYKQMLQSIHYDIRALLLKLADRLHNMRTLKSMPTNKQIKIASETDYFYAPLANRLGLYRIKTELENLSFRYRLPVEYEEVNTQIARYVSSHAEAAEQWMTPIRGAIGRKGIVASVTCEPRSAYSIWTKMQEDSISFSEVEHIRVVHIVYDNWKQKGMSEKEMALYIYAILTNLYIEKPGSINSYLDVSKDNNYRSLHCKLMGNEGRWMEVHIASSEMKRISNIGCLVEREHGVDKWIASFRNILKDIAGQKTSGFMEDVRSTFYEDDIFVFTPKGKMIVLPKGATAIDFAFEIHNKVGENMKFAVINDKLCSIKTQLQKGDRVRIGTGSEPSIDKSWLDHVVTYKARYGIRRFLYHQPSRMGEEFLLCPDCRPISGDEVIGFRRNDGKVEVHDCHCTKAIALAAQRGESIVTVDMADIEQVALSVHFHIQSVNKDQLLLDLVRLVSEDMKLSIGNVQSTISDEIVTTNMEVYVRSHNEIRKLKEAIAALPNVYGLRTS